MTITPEVANLEAKLRICESNLRGTEQANEINYNLMLQEQERWYEIYRLVFPEESPWGPVQLSEGVTCSPYQWDKLIARLKENAELRSQLQEAEKKS